MSRPKSHKYVARAVMLRPSTVALMLAIIARMEHDAAARTGLPVRIPYATFLDSLVRERARLLRVAEPPAPTPSLAALARDGAQAARKR